MDEGKPASCPDETTADSRHPSVQALVQQVSLRLRRGATLPPPLCTNHLIGLTDAKDVDTAQGWRTHAMVHTSHRLHPFSSAALAFADYPEAAQLSNDALALTLGSVPPSLFGPIRTGERSIELPLQGESLVLAGMIWLDTSALATANWEDLQLVLVPLIAVLCHADAHKINGSNRIGIVATSRHHRSKAQHFFCGADCASDANTSSETLAQACAVFLGIAETALDLRAWIGVLLDKNARVLVFARFVSAITSASGMGANFRLSISISLSIHAFTVEPRKTNVLVSRGKGLNVVCAPRGWPVASSMHKLIVFTTRLYGAIPALAPSLSVQEVANAIYSSMVHIGQQQAPLLPLVPEGMHDRITAAFATPTPRLSLRLPLAYLEAEHFPNGTDRRTVYFLSVAYSVGPSPLGDRLPVLYMLPMSPIGFTVVQARGTASGSASVQGALTLRLTWMYKAAWKVEHYAIPADALQGAAFRATRRSRSLEFTALSLAQVTALLFPVQHLSPALLQPFPLQLVHCALRKRHADALPPPVVLVEASELQQLQTTEFLQDASMSAVRENDGLVIDELQQTEGLSLGQLGRLSCLQHWSCIHFDFKELHREVAQLIKLATVVPACPLPDRARPSYDLSTAISMMPPSSVLACELLDFALELVVNTLAPALQSLPEWWRPLGFSDEQACHLGDKRFWWRSLQACMYETVKRKQVLAAHGKQALRALPRLPSLMRAPSAKDTGKVPIFFDGFRLDIPTALVASAMHDVDAIEVRGIKMLPTAGQYGFSCTIGAALRALPSVAAGIEALKAYTLARVDTPSEPQV